jgi:hypothetical protein
MGQSRSGATEDETAKEQKSGSCASIIKPNLTYWDVRSVFSTAAIQEISFSGSTQ